jgi:hypothetical protein
MYQYKSIIFFVKRHSNMQAYLSNHEVREMSNDLTPQEINVYTRIRDVCLGNNPAEALENAALAQLLDISQKNLSNIKSNLKTKGYMLFVWSKDPDGTKNCKVYAGKEQVRWYNLGLRVELSNSRAHRKLLDKFPIDDPSLTLADREDLVKQANQYFLDNPHEFKK